MTNKICLMTNKKGLDEKLANLLLLAERVADPLGLKVVEVKFGQEGKRRTLEVTIFRPDDPVSHADCETVSRHVEALLDDLANDEAPIVEGAYSLVVQSPGIARKLKTERDLQIFSGQTVQVQTRERVADLGDNFTGILLGFVEDRIKLAHPRTLAPHAKATASTKNKSKVSTPHEHEDIDIKRSEISEIKLFAKDLLPKGTPAH
jgi:ribosome maturation factor RimP